MLLEEVIVVVLSIALKRSESRKHSQIGFEGDPTAHPHMTVRFKPHYDSGRHALPGNADGQTKERFGLLNWRM